MRMKKVWMTGMLILMMLGFFLFFCGMEVKSEMNQPEFVMGDWWEYEGSYWYNGIKSNMNFTGRIEVKGCKEINLVGKNFSVKVISANTSIMSNGVSIFYSNFTSYFDIKTEHCVGAFAEIWGRDAEGTHKNIAKFIFDPLEKTGLWGQVCQIPEVASAPSFIEYPLVVGRSYETKINYISESEYIGNELHEKDKNNGSNVAKYECIGKENINVKAGTYECYVLQNTTYNEKQEFKILGYFSEKVGIGPVKTEIIIQNLDTKEEIYHHTVELTSFRYSGITEDNGESTPGFEVFLLMVGIGIILIWKRW